MEQYNPEYNRKLKQRTKEVWGPKFVKGSMPALSCSSLTMHLHNCTGDHDAEL